ncbi:MAG: hypothetical protein ACR2I8_03890, partial [Steroidobacteraceae bacterium]
MSDSLKTAFRRYAPWGALVLVYVLLGLVGRVVLWARFGLEADVGASELPYVLGAGLLNDLVE